MLNNYELGDKILQRLELWLDEDEVSVEDLNTATFVMLNVRESRKTTQPVSTLTEPETR